MTSTPLDRRTRATLRSAEFGFLGVFVYTRVQTPRRWGEHLRPGVLELAVFTFLVEQIGQAAVQYIGSFPLITVADFNAYIQERNRHQAPQA